MRSQGRAEIVRRSTSTSRKSGPDPAAVVPPPPPPFKDERGDVNAEEKSGGGVTEDVEDEDDKEDEECGRPAVVAPTAEPPPPPLFPRLPLFPPVGDVAGNVVVVDGASPTGPQEEGKKSIPSSRVSTGNGRGWNASDEPVAVTAAGEAEDALGSSGGGGGARAGFPGFVEDSHSEDAGTAVSSPSEVFVARVVVVVVASFSFAEEEEEVGGAEGIKGSSRRDKRSNRCAVTRRDDKHVEYVCIGTESNIWPS